MKGPRGTPRGRRGPCTFSELMKHHCLEVNITWAEPATRAIPCVRITVARVSTMIGACTLRQNLTRLSRELARTRACIAQVHLPMRRTLTYTNPRHAAVDHVPINGSVTTRRPAQDNPVVVALASFRDCAGARKFRRKRLLPSGRVDDVLSGDVMYVHGC